MTTLVLARHAEAGNDAQARRLAERLKAFTPAVVYTSPLARALATARLVTPRPIEVEALREIDFGDVDGVPFEQLPVQLREGLLRTPTAVRFPGGESYAELQERVCAALDRIVAFHSEETVVVVTHSGPIRAALARWLDIGDRGVFRIDQRFGALNVVDWMDATPVVRLVNG